MKPLERRPKCAAKLAEFAADLRVIFVLRGSIVYALDIGARALYRT